MKILSKKALKKALDKRDLTDPNEGEHAIQLLISEITETLKKAWSCQVHVYRQSPIVSVQENYNRLHYPADGPARAERYTRYVCEEALLRTSTTAMVPPALSKLQQSLTGEDLIVCPGLVYRRDSIDRLHLGEIHQMDLWRVSEKTLTGIDLCEMINLIISTVLPGRKYRLESRTHPYTLEGLQMDVSYEGNWVEIGECGLAHPDILQENLPERPELSGLAMGLGLDRILMIRKGLKDVRLIDSNHPQISAQMLDLSPYREVSVMPSVKRDISLVVDRDLTLEEIGDLVREELGERANWVEDVDLIGDSSYEDLPQQVIQKLGMNPTQKNILLRIELKALDRTLMDRECNEVRNQIYALLHKGTYWEWADTGLE